MICHRSKAVSRTQLDACLMVMDCSPCLHLFLIIQSAHIPQMIIARSCLEHISASKSVAHVTGCRIGIFTPVIINTWCQNSLATIHSIKTCLTDSSVAPHTSQLAIGSMCRLHSTCLAGRNSCNTRHQNTLTLGGTSSFQIILHTPSDEVFGWSSSPCLLLLSRSLYADRTE